MLDERPRDDDAHGDPHPRLDRLDDVLDVEIARREHCVQSLRSGFARATLGIMRLHLCDVISGGLEEVDAGTAIGGICSVKLRVLDRLAEGNVHMAVALLVVDDDVLRGAPVLRENGAGQRVGVWRGARTM